MSHRTSRALFAGEPSSPPLASESFLQRNVNYLQSTPKHAGSAKSPDFGLEFSEIFDGNLTITSGAFDRRHSATASGGPVKKDVIQVTQTGINFGFIAVGDEATMVYKFRNSNADEQLCFRVSLEQTENSRFQLDNKDLVVGPREEGAITLRFRAPSQAGLYYNRLFLEKLNGLYQKYTIKLIACSGRSDIRVADSHIADGSMVYSQSGKIVFKPDFYPPPPSIVYPNCHMTLVNKGQRSAFVLIRAVDQKDQPDQEVKIYPQTYILGQNDSKRFKITVSRRNENLHNCSTKLRVMWGEEFQRQGYKTWREQSVDRTLVYGEDFAQQFPNEEMYRKTKEDDVFEQNRDEFRNAVRIFEINVVDSRLMSLYRI